MLAGGEELRIGGVEIAVAGRARPRRAAAAAGDAADVVRASARMVDHRTRGGAGARPGWRSAPPALAARGGRVLVLVASGGGDDERASRRWSQRLTPSTVLVEALRGGRRTGTGSGWVLDAGAGLVVTDAHVVNQGDPLRVAVGGRARPRRARRRRAVRGPRAAAGRRRRGPAQTRRSARAPASSRARRSSRSASRPARRPATRSTSTRGVVSSASTDLPRPGARRPRLPRGRADRHRAEPGQLRRPARRPRRPPDRRQRRRAHDRAPTAGRCEGQNYAIAIDRARRVLDELRSGRSIGWTGATFGYPTTAELLRRASSRRGCYLTGAVPGTPAARAGLGGRGELLAGVDGRPIASSLSSYCAAVAGRDRRRAAQAHARAAGRRQVARGHGARRRDRPHRTPGVAAAVILAGGRSSRMGSPKALVELGGRPLVAWVLAAALDAGLEAVVVAKPGSALPAGRRPGVAGARAAAASAHRRRRRARARGPARRGRPRLRHAVRDAAS